MQANSFQNPMSLSESKQPDQAAQDEVKWYYKKNLDPWDKNAPEEWAEYTPEETIKIKKAFYSKQKIVEIGDYIIFLAGPKFQMHRINQSDQRPVKMVYKGQESAPRQERYTLPPCKPITANKLNKIYPALIKRWAKENGICQYGFALLGNYASKEIMKRLIEASIEGIWQEGISQGHNDEAAEITRILQEYIDERDLDVIGRVCLHLYTKQTFLYSAVNRALREQDSSKSNTLGPYCTILFYFIWRAWVENRDLPSYSSQVYRGANLTPEMIETYKEIARQDRPHFAWHAFTSTTKDIKRARIFGNTLFVINFEEKMSGVEISAISAFPHEEEVFFNANSEFSLIKIEQEENGKYIIYLEKRMISYYYGVHINEKLLASGVY